MIPGPAGSSTVRLRVEVTAPSNHLNANSAFWPVVSWYASATVPATPSADTCTFGRYDRASTYIEAVASCPGGDLGTYSVQVKTCGFLACAPPASLEGMRFQVTPTMLGCCAPRESACNGDAACDLCLGPGQSASSTGGGPALGGRGQLGPGAEVRYAAGGVGGIGLPGSPAWNPVLGRFWSHDYAERIVQDPDARHVWLLTRWATFREFTDAAGDGAYEQASPRDEYRKLQKMASGWELLDLEGTIHRFDNAGLWQSTTDRFGNAKTATYGGGQLTAVDFPDGRREPAHWRWATDNSSNLTEQCGWTPPGATLCFTEATLHVLDCFPRGRVSLPGCATTAKHSFTRLAIRAASELTSPTGGKSFRLSVQGGRSEGKMLHLNQAGIRSGLLILAAWLPVAVPLTSLLEWLPPNRYEFGVSRVCVPYTPGTDVVSLVPDLFSTLTLAGLCLLLAEIAKAIASNLPGRRVLRHLCFTLFQVALALDILRKYAWDWYGYLLYFARLISLSHERPRPEVIPIPPPWPSFFLLCICVGLCVYSTRGGTPEGDRARR